MEIVDAVCSRKSIRGFKPDQVPKEVIWEILDIARRAPSGVNSQPWEITVVTGEVLDDIKRDDVEMLNSGAPPDPDTVWRHEGIYRQRQVELAVEVFRLMGIAREDKEKRAEWTQRSFRFYNAPALIIISIDKSLDRWRLALLDIGAIMQTICLVALNYGLGTCIGGQGIMFPEVVRNFTSIPESKRLLTSIAIGYPDWDFPINALETKREAVENFVTWCGWS